MADQIVITEKTSQAKDVRAAVGSRYGDILPAEGHLLDLLEPEDVVPAWKRWSPILLRPEGLYGTRPAEGGNKAAKLKAIREVGAACCKIRPRDHPSRSFGPVLLRLHWRGEARSKRGQSACGVYLPDLEQPRPPDKPPSMVKLRLVRTE